LIRSVTRSERGTSRRKESLHQRTHRHCDRDSKRRLPDNVPAEINKIKKNGVELGQWNSTGTPT